MCWAKFAGYTPLDWFVCCLAHTAQHVSLSFLQGFQHFMEEKKVPFQG